MNNPMQCPYRGLSPLSEEDQALFAGRQQEISMIISSLYASPLTILYGESGVGKTSLIRAGLLPELKAPEHRVAAVLFREWQSSEFDVNLRTATLTSLLATINSLTSEGESLTWDAFLEKFLSGLNLKHPEMYLKSAPDLYAQPLDWFIKECSAAFYGRLFFIFDQFEEYVYYHPLKEKGEQFDAELARAINDRSVPASFLICLREDGLGKLDRLRGRVPDLLENVIKLEHLDETGAVEAINKPLLAFEKSVNIKVELSSELITLLVEQVDEERLELDQGLDGNAKEVRLSDYGPRYKVLALQAVLIRLWQESVVPALSDPARIGRKIVISQDALTRLARKKSEGEDEVRFIVRTYFDQQLRLLDNKIQRNAAEILPHLIRPGSQKKARSTKVLAQESGIPEASVSTTVEKLKEEPLNLVRAVPAAENKNPLYELQHDVMAFAVQDWCIRRRQKTRESRIVWSTVIGTAVVTLVAVILGNLFIKSQESASWKAATVASDIAMAVDASGGSAYKPLRGLLVGIDTVASCRENHQPIPENALIALRLGTLRIGPTESQKEVETVWRDIPAMVSPDKKYLLAIEPGSKINIFKYDQSWNSKSYDLKGKPPFEIAFSEELDRIGLRSSDGFIQVWDFKKGEPEWQESKGDLKTFLGFQSEIPTKNRKAIDGLADYESLVKKWLFEALGSSTGMYSEKDDIPKPHFDSPLLSEEFAQAREYARGGNVNKALSLLFEEFRPLRFEVDQTKISEILAASFMRSANDYPEGAEESFGIAQRLFPNLEKKIKAQREIMRGNQLRLEMKYDDAVAAYKKAVLLDPELENSLHPEIEARAPGAPVTLPTPGG
jgi:hypothetical protein